MKEILNMYLYSQPHYTNTTEYMCNGVCVVLLTQTGTIKPALSVDFCFERGYYSPAVSTGVPFAHSIWI